MSTVTAPARLLIPPDVSYEEWKEQRAALSRSAVTASEIAIILGISPWGSPFNLHYLKRGLITDDFEDNAMSLGRHLEPWIADRFAEDHPEYAVSLAGMFASTARPWQISTPDRILYAASRRALLVDDPIALLEIKSSGTYDGWGEDGTDEIPAYYRAQVLWQLDTLGLGEAHVCCLFLGNRQIRNYLIKYDVTDVDLMRKAAQEFLAQVADGTPPPLDGHKATTAALKALHPTLDEDAEAEVSADLAKEYGIAVFHAAGWKSRKAALENELRAAMGDAKYALHNGQKVATRSVYDQSGMDTKRLRAEHPDAYADCRTTTTVDKLTPARAKKEAP